MEHRPGGTVLLDDGGALLAYTEACPGLLGVPAEDAAVAAAVASTVVGLEDGRTTRTASGCAITARRLSNGGWALELRPSAPRADPETLAEILDSIDASPRSATSSATAASTSSTPTTRRRKNWRD